MEGKKRKGKEKQQGKKNNKERKNRKEVKKTTREFISKKKKINK